MGAIQNDGARFFASLNTNKLSEDDVKAGKKEVLDNKEIAKAKLMGFSMFELKENMTIEDFTRAYCDVMENAEDGGTTLMKQEKDVKAKYLQLKYGSKSEIQEDEDLDTFEARLKQEANDNVLQSKPTMGFEFIPGNSKTKQNGAITPDTMNEYENGKLTSSTTGFDENDDGYIDGTEIYSEFIPGNSKTKQNGAITPDTMNEYENGKLTRSITGFDENDDGKLEGSEILYIDDPN